MSEAAPPPAVTARAERHMRVLERLADKGMELTEAIPADGTPASAETFAKFSRSVRLTITLEAKIDAALAARLAGEMPEIETPRARSKSAARAEPARDDAANDERDMDPYPELKTGPKGRARELLIDVIDREITDVDDWDDAVDALDERLVFDVSYANLDEAPLREIVERLCADLELKPDWDLWTGDGWAPHPPLRHPRPSLFPSSSRRPVLDQKAVPHTRE